MKSISIDLGCGKNPRNPFDADLLYGIDVRPTGIENQRTANLVLEPIPFPDSSVNFITAYDFIEHIPRTIAVFDRRMDRNVIINPFIELMNEIYRVLIEGGLFLSSTPAFPHPEAFQDPTHCNIITEKTFPLYFNDHYPVASIYGFKGAFKILSQKWEGFSLITVLQKAPKPRLKEVDY